MATSIPEAKRKFLQSLERKIYNLNNERIKEQVVDFTVLYLRRNNIRHTPEDLANILEVFRMAMDDAYLKNIDNFIATVSNDLDNVVEAVDPLNTTDSKKSSTTTVAGTVREESVAPVAKKKPATTKKQQGSVSSSAASKSR